MSLREKLGRIIAWLGLLAWMLWLVAHGVALGLGGMARVVAWYFVVQLVPMSALLVLAVTVPWLAWRRRATLPHKLLMSTAVPALLPGIVGFGLYSIAYPLTSLSSAVPAAIVRLPTDREMIVAWGGDSIETNYHAADPGQRWAYDLLIEPAAHGGSLLSSYGCYGVPVLAPASGRVTVAEDGHPEGRPAAYVPNAEAPAGNYVSIEMQTGSYLIIAHLQPASVAVSVGDEVTEGQPLGLCGNSGNTSEPHIHIHHQRQDPALIGLLAEGLPLYFRSVQGFSGEVMPRGGVEMDGESVRFTGDRVLHAR